MNFFGPSAQISLEWQDSEVLPRVLQNPADESKSSELVMFSAEQSIAGTVHIKLPDSVKKLDHTGIKAELIGQIELAYDRGNHYVFLSMQKELMSPGTLKSSQSFPFEFSGADKNYETYSGINVRLRYFVRVRISRSYGTKIVKEFDFAVNTTTPAPEENEPLKMEVGIEDCLHIEFEYEKSKYMVGEVIAGKIDFLLVRIKIKHMEMQILKRESTGSGPNMYNETEVITKFEIMDGAPVKGETIPIRLFLKPFEKKGKLTPTFRTVHNKFSVKYYLNLVLVDEEDRRYFKQQEITLYRDKASPAKTVGLSG